MSRLSASSSRACSSPTNRNVNINKLLSLLDSDDKQVENDIRQALHYQLGMGQGIRQLVNHYYEHGSGRALDLLTEIKDPHDFALLDVVKEMMMNAKKTPAAIILLGQIVQSAPSWVPRIAKHEIFQTVLKFVNRTHTHVMAEDIAALLFLASLLPHCAVMSEIQLRQLFDTFVNAAGFLQGKMRDLRANTNPVDRINVSHLQYAVREYFHSLYGIYPYMLIHHLRSYFKTIHSPEQQAILDGVVIPLLNGVKLHPNLLIMDREKELSRERWAKKEAHDFLDDCRRVVIGLIPTTYNVDQPDVEGESRGGEGGDDIFLALLPTTSQDGQMSNTQTEESAATDAINTGANFDLMSLLNTPPGTRSSSPHGRAINESLKDSVISSRQRDASGNSSRSRSFISQLIGNVKKAISPQVERVYEPLIEVVAEDGDNASGTVSTAEEAEEVFDVDHLLSAKVTMVQRERAESNAEEMRKTSQKHSVQRLSGEFDERSRDPSGNSGGKRSGPRRSDPMVNYMDEVVAAREAARQSVRERGFTIDETKVHLNDAGDFMYNNNAISSDSVSNTSHEDLDVSSEPQHLVRPRFSVSAFFNKFNRQRFHSECPPLQNDETDITGQVKDENSPELEGATSKNVSEMQGLRSSSCPDIRDLLRRRRSVPDAFVNQIESQTFQSIAFPQNEKQLLQAFPYLTLITGPQMSLYGKLEKTLEQQHEENRAAYIAASKAYHNTLKDLYLADRLPGRIYDDMSHILQDLTPEAQTEVLQSRLRLVNQHLLYERSCRLLHANRNRRLYGRIRLQKNLENELARYRENEIEMLTERENLIKALSQMRSQEKKLKDESKKALQQLKEKYALLAEKNKKLEFDVKEQDMKIQILEDDLEKKSQPIELAWRKATDAEACIDITQKELDATRAQLVMHEGVARENQQLKDQIEMLKKKNQDIGMSPEVINRIRSLEIACGDYENRIAILNGERDNLETSVTTFEEIVSGQKRELEMLHEKLRRAARQINEQADAAEQKFISLQLVCRELESHVNELYLKLESIEESPIDESVEKANIFSFVELPESERGRVENWSSAEQMLDSNPDSPVSLRPSPAVDNVTGMDRSISVPPDSYDNFVSTSPPNERCSLP
ncbi:unnamed protein product, partial [Mesorhabditis belari]|uniref:Hamartin n=1 Tax=Mesorhabditis belari TaxID=2138241 RepID=A0AAF3EYH4_9BILA